MTNTLEVEIEIASPLMSFEDFLNYDDGTDALYELEDRRLRIMTVESELNRLSTSFLFAYFLQQGISFSQLSMKTEVTVSGTRTTVRLPDLLVLTEELVAEIAGSRRSLVTLEMPPPRLAIEVVSPGRENAVRPRVGESGATPRRRKTQGNAHQDRRKGMLTKTEDRDYRYKRSQYQARGIDEYWIVNPIQQQITVLSLVAGLYEEAVFTGEKEISSPLLQELGSSLTVRQILTHS
ncbi:MAG: Uma2 family endonuclease [Cyanobacteria bacterium P01_E01_bin.42]